MPVIPWLALSLVALGAGACGGSSATSQEDNVAPLEEASVTTMVVMDAQGMHPALLTIAPGERLLFVNDDVDPHSIVEAPRTAANDRDDCPEIAAGLVQPGESVMVSVGPHGRPCAYVDGLDPVDARFAGTITVQASVHRNPGQRVPGPTRATSFP